MGQKTTIPWCHHTHNPWWGCEKISPGCTNCYAADFDHRLKRDEWGANKPRRFFGDKHWNEPRRWNELARKIGERHRVFCGSMCDVLEDRRDLDEHRDRLWKLIEETPFIDWLLLTKRPGNADDLFPRRWFGVDGGFPMNIWFGCTTENQEEFDKRVPELMKYRWLARVLFLSMEPQLERIDIARAIDGRFCACGRDSELISGGCPSCEWCWVAGQPAVDWIITGGESGRKARPYDLAWAREIRDACNEHGGVAFFMKQQGDKPQVGDVRLRVVTSKGEEPSEWPEDLRIRQFPQGAAA